MYEAEVTIKGITSYGANAMVPDDAPMDVRKKPANETWDSYMRRVLPYTIHTDKKTGNLIIPANALKLCVTSAAQLDGIKVPNRGSMTYGKLFKVGVKIPKGIILPYDVTSLESLLEPQSVPADGRHGGTKRVTRYFWWVERWGGTFNISVVHGQITKSVLENTLYTAGTMVGLGMYRPENNGDHGVFIVESIKYSGDVVEK